MGVQMSTWAAPEAENTDFLNVGNLLFIHEYSNYMRDCISLVQNDTYTEKKHVLSMKICHIEKFKICLFLHDL